MIHDIIYIISFIMLVIIACITWNLHAMKQYEKSKQNTLDIIYDFNVEKLNIAGEGNDKNGVYDVSDAIEEIKMPCDLRIKGNE